jgi:acyl-CoA reductase-like NAD-dependent aldehyde dehydrogenase
VLELGGNAAVIVDEDADLEDAVERIVFGAYYQSGQSCISVQRVMVHESLFEEFRRRLVDAVSRLESGDPLDEDTFIGPMISEDEAARLAGWIESAVTAGARLLCGGDRQGSMLEPTVLENVPLDHPIACQEAFGPVVVLSSFGSFDEAIRQVNDSRFGLQAGVCTRDLHKALAAWDRLEVGGVVVGDVPSYRIDNMPYGGIKDSGLGREGVRHAIEDFTEIRLLVIREPE